MARRFKRAKGKRKKSNNEEKVVWFRDQVWYHYELYKERQLRNASDALRVDGDLPKDEVFLRCQGFCAERSSTQMSRDPSSTRVVELKPGHKAVLLPNSNPRPPIPRATPQPRQPRPPPYPPPKARPVKCPQAAPLKKPIPKAMPKRSLEAIEALERELARTPLPKPMPKKRPRR